MSYINPVDMDNHSQQRISKIQSLAKDQIGGARHGVELPPEGFQGQARAAGWRRQAVHVISAVLSFVTRV
jgi:hypothetical protein